MQFRPTAQQSAIIDHDTGPAIVVSAAGVGKTTTLVERVKRLQGRGYDLSRILILAYSTKAVEDTKTKCRKAGVPLFVDNNYGVCVRTLHSMSHEIIKFAINAKLYPGQDKEPEVPPEWMIHKTIAKSGAFDVLKKVFRGSTASIYELISMAKSKLIWPDSWESDAGDKSPTFEAWLTDNYDYAPTTVAALDSCYRELENFSQDPQQFIYSGENVGWYCSFDDMVALVARAVDSGAQWVDPWAGMFSHVMLDECQDSALSNWVTASFLARNESLLAVGDDFQSIFGFRGAVPDLMHVFAEREDVAKYYLSHNFRSDLFIVTATNRVVNADPTSLNKGAVCTKDNVGFVRYKHCYSTYDEADFIVNRIVELNNLGVPWADMAVLYRNHAMSTAVQLEMCRCDIPFKTVNNQTVMSSFEISAFLGYVFCAIGHDVGSYTKDMVRANAPYLKNTELLKAHDLNCIADLEMRLVGKTKKSIRDLIEHLTILGPMLEQDAPLEDIFNYIVDEADLLTKLDKRGCRYQDDYDSKVFIDALFAFMDRIDRPTQEAFAEVHQIRNSFTKEFGVNLTTIHSSKGLEWPYVFVLGNNEGSFPQEPGDDESLRLFYVALSRAMHGCYLTSSSAGYKTSHPSEFIDIARPLDLCTMPE